MTDLNMSLRDSVAKVVAAGLVVESVDNSIYKEDEDNTYCVMSFNLKSEKFKVLNYKELDDAVDQYMEYLQVELDAFAKAKGL